VTHVHGELTAVSLFDGIGGFPLALSRAGIRTVATVEIDKAAAGVTCDQFPDARHFDDVTKVTADEILAAGFCPVCGIVCAGWPCQDLSLAGRRLGLGGARSGLFWEIVRLARDLRPRWLILENVPGLLSAVCSCPGLGRCEGTRRRDPDTLRVVRFPCIEPHGVGGGDCGRKRRRRDGKLVGRGRCMELHGGAMGAVLGALGELGYGFAYRVLDAQHFGVPQRRRRVVIVGCLGDWIAPAQVLLEPDGDERDSAPCGAARQGTTGVSAGSTLQGGGRRGRRVDAEPEAGEHLAPLFDTSRETVGTLTTGLQRRPGGLQEMELLIGVDTYNGSVGAEAITLRGSRPDHLPHVLGFDAAQITSGENRSNPQPGDPQPPLAATSQPHVAYALRADPGGVGQGHNTNYVAATSQPHIAFGHTNGLDVQASESATPTLRAGHHVGGGSAASTTTVRRLTPVECERLQGYPDGWTATSNGKPQADAPRYRQLGNSIAVPVFEWVAQRIVAHEHS
jgi:DNA (cytosine-5)-methyltransferase 1